MAMPQRLGAERIVFFWWEGGGEGMLSNRVLLGGRGGALDIKHIMILGI